MAFSGPLGALKKTPKYLLGQEKLTSNKIETIINYIIKSLGETIS